MSAEIPEPRIPREKVEKMAAKLGGKTVEFTRQEMTLFTFYQPWTYMRHLYLRKTAEDGTVTGVYYFNGDDDLFMSMAELKLNEFKAAEPTDSDVDAYEKFQSQILDKELAGLGKSE